MKILIQAGHAGRISGSTGAPEEQKWTTEIVPKIAARLRDFDFYVKEIGADPTDSEIAGDWNLFLSVHYDADIYNDRGGFIDTPDPSTDFATVESNRIAAEIRKTYFSTTGIPERKERSNKNTRFYYMWSKMSAKTPCVIIEAGVGYRTPEDHQTLWFEQDKVVKGIVDGIVAALMPEEIDQCKEYKDQIIIIQKQLDVALEANGKLSDQVEKLQKEIDDHVCPITPPVDNDFGEETGTKTHSDGNGNLEWVEKTYKPIK